MPNVNVMHEPSIPQTVNGVVIDGSTGGGVAPAPFTSQALAWFSVWPGAVNDYLIATDATFSIALVSAYAIVPAGSKVTIYQGILSSIPPVSQILVEWDGNQVPGVNAITLNVKMNPAIAAGTQFWARIWNTGLPALGLTVVYTGAQQ